VLDENGQQLNPLMAGAGYASFTNDAVENWPTTMVAGDTISLAELFKILMGSLKFPAGTDLPTLAQLIAGFQDSINSLATPSRPNSPLLMVALQSGPRRVADPARITSTTVNPLAEEPIRVELPGTRR